MSTTVKWASGASGSFTDGGDWVGGVAPGSADTAVISAHASHRYTVTLSTAVTLAGLDLEQKRATLADTGTLTAASVIISAGTLLVSGSLVAGNLTLDGGTLALAGGTLGGMVTQAGGTLDVGALGGTLDNVTWRGALAVDATAYGTMTIDGSLNLTGASGTGTGTASFRDDTVVLNAVATLNGAVIDGGEFDVTNMATLTLGSGLTFEGNALDLTATESVVNQGTISSGTINGGTFTNNGIIQGFISDFVDESINNGTINTQDGLFSDVSAFRAPRKIPFPDAGAMRFPHPASFGGMCFGADEFLRH
jgi:hypothetical protein